MVDGGFGLEIWEVVGAGQDHTHDLGTGVGVLSVDSEAVVDAVGNHCNRPHRILPGNTVAEVG